MRLLRFIFRLEKCLTTFLLIMCICGIFAKDLQECENLGNASYLCREIESFEQLSRYVGKNWRSVKIVNEQTGLDNEFEAKLPALSGLIRLDLSKSGGVTFNGNGLQDFTELQELNLTSCQLEELQEQHFPIGSKIVNLDVSFNDIQLITGQKMSRLASLVYGNFSNNLIAEIEPNSFRDMKNLRFLDFTTNEQENITLGENANLQYLSISNNNVRDVSLILKGFFSRIPSRITLNSIVPLVPTAWITQAGGTASAQQLAGKPGHWDLLSSTQVAGFECLQQ